MIADLDKAWARSFLVDLLERWREPISQGNGLFRPFFAEDWSRRETDQPLILVSQCRLIYTMSVGYQLTGDQRFRDVALQGLEAFEKYFRVGGSAHYCWSVTQSGEHDIPNVNAYGYAFVILAQATAASALENPNLAEQALQTWKYVHSELGDEYGGLRWHRAINRSAIPNDANSQNPVMHTFEALMALARCDAASVEVRSEALGSCESIYDFMKRLEGFTSGKLVEWYTPDWKRQPLESGGFIDLGHAFEWAYLLSEWHAISADAGALEIGHKFLDTAIGWGLASDGGINNHASPSGEILSISHGLWQQCEAVRALYRFATCCDHPNAAEHFPRALSYYRQHFIDTLHGGVFAGPIIDGKLHSKHKGDCWKLDYHSTNMLLEIFK